MKTLSRIVVVAAVLAAMLGLAGPARAEDCKAEWHKGAVNYLYCTLVGGCIASGPEAVDPVVCD